MQTFFNALTPVNIFLKIFGLWPYSLTSSKSARSISNVIWGVIILLLLQGYLITTIVYLEHHPKFIDKIMLFVDLYSGVLIILCGFVCQWLFATDITSILNGINEFDQYAQQKFQVDLQIKYKSLKKYSIISVVGTLTLISFSIASTITVNIGFNSSTGHLTNITIPKMMSSLILLPFFVLILSLRQRFIWINNAIERKHKVLYQLITEKTANGFFSFNILKFIESLRLRHSSLTKMCKNLNKVYHAQLLTILFKNVVSITIGIFYFGKTIINNKFSFTFMFFPLTESITSLIQTLALALVCSETTLQAKKTTELLCKLSIINNYGRYYDLKRKINLEIMFFSLQVLQNRVEFTAFRMFVIKEKFLVSVVATIVMYLVIVVQLSVLAK